MAVSVDDYVLINTTNGISVGKVAKFHDLGDYPDPYRAEIHWLYKYNDLTKKCCEQLEERSNELFLPVKFPDKRPIRGSIEVVDAETISEVNKVTLLRPKEDFPLVNKCKDDGPFYMKYAFDDQDNIYYATEYLSRLSSALKSYADDLNNNECGTPKASCSATPNTRMKNNYGAEKQWRIGTPKTRSSTNSPALNGLRLVLKLVKMKPNITPVKRKASKSIPDEGEVESKKSKSKIKPKQREKQVKQKGQEKQKTVKPTKSPKQTFVTEEVVELMMSDDHDEDDEDEDATDEDDEDFEEEEVSSDEEDEKEDEDVFVEEKKFSKTRSTAKTPSGKNKQYQNEKTPVHSGRSLRYRTPSHAGNNDWRTPSKTPRSTARSRATGRPESVNHMRQTHGKGSSKTPSQTPSGRALSKSTTGVPGSKTPLKTPGKPNRRKSVAQGLTPSIPSRSQPCKTPRTPLQEARTRLHVSAVPSSLPCRDDEFEDILSFVQGKLVEGSGGCMYISGVPGTGKTATVHEVIHILQESKVKHIPNFRFIEVNGMKLTEPNQTYSTILKKLTGQKAMPTHASDLLEKIFSKQDSKKESVVLMVDELDLLWTRKQGVMYNLFEWPSRQHSRLVVLAIANTMDLPERMMINRVQSRLGLTRITFQPYTYSQLQEIVLSRIQNLNVFDPDAMQLVSRKVAAVSGDARRCLDICRRAVEIAELENKSSKSKKGKLVGMTEVNTALQDMFSSPKIKLMMNLSSYECLVMRAVLSEFKRTGVEETKFGDVFDELCNLCRIEGIPPPIMTEASAIVSRIGASRLLLVETGRLDLQRRISLNVNQDDVIYALKSLTNKKV
ncbi:origin recognition complex subunit 1-like isoform X2 [Actinia tenebrosa]|nr:origin recognition complex subunit 1-like isoform X2 [Actinia tenebrosa]